jgi:hypothetical protein
MKIKYKYFVHFIALLSLSFLVTRFLSVLLGGVMEDDSFFYAQIAYNIGVNNISSFDGINITDGYHILWAYLLGTVSKIVNIFTDDKIIHLFFYNFIYISIGYFIVKIFDNIKLKILAVGTFIVATFLMETALLSLIILLILTLLYKEKYNYAILILMFIPIIRIDSTLIIIATPLYFLMINEKKLFFHSMIAISLGIAIHFISLYSISCEFSSVSNLIKTHEKYNLLENFRNNYRNLYARIILSIVYLIFSFYVILKAKHTLKEKHLYLLGLFLLFGYLFLFIHFFMNGNLRSWYFMTSLFISLFIFYKAKISNNLFIAIFILLSSIIIKKTYYTYISYEDNRNVDKYISKLKEVVPNNQSVYLIDGSGYIGYFSERSIVNGDGLVNSHEYFNSILSNNLENYLKENNIQYIADNERKKHKFLINYHGLQIKYDDVETLISKKENLYYSLYKLK